MKHHLIIASNFYSPSVCRRVVIEFQLKFGNKQDLINNYFLQYKENSDMVTTQMCNMITVLSI